MPRYFSTVDQFRFLAALSVILGHYPLLFRLEPTQSALLNPVNPEWFFTPLAVPFFWMLSGFVFLLQYRDRAVTAARFARQRFARLYPLHLLTLLLVLVLQMASSHQFGAPLFFGNVDAYHFLLQIGFASAWGFEEGLSYNGPVWSVSIEILVYALFFVLLPCLRRSAAMSLAAALCAFVLYRFLAPHQAFLCAVYFFMGCLCFEAVRYFANSTLVAVAAVLLGTVVLARAAGVYRLDTFQNIAVFWGVISCSAVFDCRFPHYALHPKSVWNLGNYTYAMYLLHIPLMLVVANVAFALIGDDTSIYRHPVTLMGFAVLCLGASVLTYRYFELPMKRWLNAW